MNEPQQEPRDWRRPHSVPVRYYQKHPSSPWNVIGWILVGCFLGGALAVLAALVFLGAGLATLVR